MNSFVKEIQGKLKVCHGILLGDAKEQEHRFKNIDWLDGFCAEFLEFANSLQTFLTTNLDKSLLDNNVRIEMIFLCLTQVTTCVEHLERVIKAEEPRGITLTLSRQHFVDRIQWCLQRLHDSLKIVAEDPEGSSYQPLEEHTLVELLDLVLECLSIYSDFKTELREHSSSTSKADEQALEDSKEIRVMVDLLISHTLAFANAAPPADKKALSTLCQKMFRECVAFEKECSSNKNESFRKLRATSLENAITRLETVINEALLRLVYTCFLDIEVISVEKLRQFLRNSDPDDSSVDDLIADFDTNVERITQIGIFALAFAPDVKTRTKIRSCLASLESLDSYLVPALRNIRGRVNDIDCELFEQHYNEEVGVFVTAILEIVDSQAFISSYLERLSECLRAMQKRFHKQQLLEMIKMGEFLHQHCRLKINYEEIVAEPHSDKCCLFAKFQLILGECRAILMCADQVDPKRIIKRFNILAATLTKFRDAFSQEATGLIQTNITDEIESAEASSNSQETFESSGIVPSIRSILYSKAESAHCTTATPTVHTTKTLDASLAQLPSGAAAKEKRRRNNTNTNENICRKESLRTSIFKSQHAKFEMTAETTQADRSGKSRFANIIARLKNSFTSN